MRGKLAMERCRELARFSEVPGQITRTFLSPPMHDTHRSITEWCRSAGCRVSIDPAGNLRAVYGDSPRRLVIGSHLDTVPNAGAFDGILGVMIGLALIEALELRPIPFAIEIIGFSEEEGVRFGTPFIGSRAAAGALDPSLVAKISDAIRAFGLDPARLAEAELGPEVMGYLEFHIEQGPVLDDLGLPLGVVTGIVGQSRVMVTFEGEANHAGTTPMPLRRDALACAAEWILEVESRARQTPGLVATVGKLDTLPGGTNIIPGLVRASLDVRHASDEIRRCAVRQLIIRAEEIASRRCVDSSHEVYLDQSGVPMDAVLTDTLERAVRNSYYPVNRMPSGAGHDAMILAKKIPSAMLFLRSPGGISHHPDESVLVEDVDAAIATGLRFLQALEHLHV